MRENVFVKGLQREFPCAYSSKAPPTALLLATFRGVLLWRNMQGYLRREAGMCFVAGGANRVHTSAAVGGSFLVAGGANRVPIFAAGDGGFWGAGGAKGAFYLPPWGMEFFGCKQGEGVSLPTAVGAGSFLVASRARVSLYLPPRGMEFFGCRRGEGVSQPTAEGDGVFWLQAGRGCLSTYHRGGWSDLVAGGARESLNQPPRAQE